MGISAEIVSIGSEILLGHIVDTNFSYLARKMAGEGIDVFYQSVVGDNPRRLFDTIRTALSRSDIVITTGGLGPTVDDITVNAVAKAVSRPLVLNEKISCDIKRHFKKRRIAMPAGNKRQAYLPEGAIALSNAMGTAPGLIIRYGKNTIISLPGPPREMIPIFERFVIPYLRKTYRAHSMIFTRTIRTVGAPESVVNKKVSAFLKMAGDVTVGIYASPGEVDLKITAKAGNRKKALGKIKKIESQITSKLGSIVYGFDNDTLESVIGGLLLKRRLSLSVAESCTGGLISNRITDIAGSSRYFQAGVVAYSNSSKLSKLGVPVSLIKQSGAVSRKVAVAMAKGLLDMASTDYTIAVTGIAGSAGGTEKKPVGLVYIALANCQKVISAEYHFLGNRTDIKLQSSTAALNMLRKELIRK